MARKTDTTRYEKQMRKAMLAVEDICGDTEVPMKERLAAVRRIRDFCSVIVDEFDPKKDHEEAEA